MPSYMTAILRRLGDFPGTKPSFGSCVFGSSTTLRYIAVSRTVRIGTPARGRGEAGAPNFPGSRRPREALRPNRPQGEGGMRIEPPPSVPWANGKTPAATHAAEPPLDPLGL